MIRPLMVLGFNQKLDVPLRLVRCYGMGVHHAPTNFLNNASMCCYGYFFGFKNMANKVTWSEHKLFVHGMLQNLSVPQQFDVDNKIQSVMFTPVENLANSKGPWGHVVQTINAS